MDDDGRIGIISASKLEEIPEEPPLPDPSDDELPDPSDDEDEDAAAATAQLAAGSDEPGAVAAEPATEPAAPAAGAAMDCVP
jgi:hypothetical protein